MEVAPGGGLIVPDDRAWRAEEGRHGDALRASLGAAAPLLDRLLEAAAGAGDLPVLAVEAPRVVDRARRWELLAGPDRRPLEPAARGVVARVAQVPPRRWTPPACASRLRVVLWCPDQEDPSVNLLLEGLQARTSRGAPTPELLHPGAALEPWPDALTVLHVVAHGRVGLGQVLLSQREGERVVVTVAQSLARALPGVDLVHLAVCEGDAPLADPLDSLAGALLAAGCRAVLAPGERVEARSSLCFAAALHDALLDGASLPAAAAAARAAVAGLAMPERSMRWWQTGLIVGDLRELETTPLRPWWARAGWPPPHREVLPLLRRAGARAGALGFLGVEHLALAQLEQAPPPGLERLAAQLAAQREDLDRALKVFEVAGSGAAALAPTPRLRGLADALPGGFTARDLWRALAEDGGHWLGLGAALPERASTVGAGWSEGLGGALTGARLPPAPPSHRVPRLQVAGGPEDGEPLRPEDGEVVGRWRPTRPGPDLALYRNTSAVDGGVSRLHLRALAGMRVELLAPARLVRGDQAETWGPGVHAVQPGDLLFLTRGTALRVR